MAKHARTPESPEASSRGPLGRRLLGRHAVRRTQVQGAHSKGGDGMKEAAYWRSLGDDIKRERAQINAHLDVLESGLNKLVRQGSYDPAVTRRMSQLRALTMIFEGNTKNNPTLENALGYLDEHDRYITVRSLSDRSTMLHEGAHVLVRMGAKGRNIFNEPIAERVNQDIQVVEHVEDDGPPVYQPHNRVMERAMLAGGLTFRDVTRIASGDDRLQNFEVFRQEVMDGAGWDVAGVAQERYLRYTDAYRDADPGLNLSDAMYYAADMVDRELAQYIPLPDELTPVMA